MNPEVPPPLPESTSSAPATVTGDSHSSPWRLGRVLLAPVKLFWGMAFCQSVLGSVAVLGWTCRLMQRRVLKQWWGQSELTGGHLSFDNFVASDLRTRDHLHWPNWFVQQNFRDALRRDPAAGSGKFALTVLGALGRSLWMNVRIGVQAICGLSGMALTAAAADVERAVRALAPEADRVLFGQAVSEDCWGHGTGSALIRRRGTRARQAGAQSCDASTVHWADARVSS